MTLPDDLKARFCEALGVTVEEVDGLDRAMHGPEERSQRAEDEAALMAYVDEVKARCLERISAELPEGVTVTFDTAPIHRTATEKRLPHPPHSA